MEEKKKRVKKVMNYENENTMKEMAGYRILKGRFKMMAAKTLGYDKIPCLIRDTKQEILLRKINKIFKLEDKNNAIKETINDGKKSYSYDKNSFKLKIL